MKRVVSSAICLLIAGGTSVDAAVFSLPGGDIRFEPPDGYCLLAPETDQFDAALFNFHQQTQIRHNKLLAVVVDCMQLQAARSGVNRQVGSYGLLLIPWVNGEIERLSGITVGEFLDQATGAVATLDWSEMEAEADKTFDQLNLGMELGEFRSLGVLERDDDAAHVGMIMAVAAGEKVHTVGAVISMTMINSYPVTFNLYGPYHDAASVSALLSRQTGFMPALIAQNRADIGAVDRVAEQPPEDTHTGWALAALAVAVIGALVVLRSRRRGGR